MMNPSDATACLSSIALNVTLPIDSPHDPRALPGAVPGPEMQDQALGAGFAFDLGVCS